LYDENVEFVDDEFMNSLDDGHTEYRARFIESITNDESVYGRIFLKNKLAKGLVKIGPDLSRQSTADNIVISTNTFFGDNDQADRDLTLKLRPRHELVNKANSIGSKLSLDKSVLGAHLRGTDFNISPDFYIDAIEAEMNGQDRPIFVCSDDIGLEDRVASVFDVIRRTDKHYITRNHQNIQA